jgi:hypothetical protein
MGIVGRWSLVRGSGSLGGDPLEGETLSAIPSLCFLSAMRRAIFLPSHHVALPYHNPETTEQADYGLKPLKS